MVLIKGVEQDPDLGVKIVHPSINDDSEATDSDKEENNDEVAPKPPSNDDIIDANYDEITPDTPTNGINNETIDNDEEKKWKRNWEGNR